MHPSLNTIYFDIPSLHLYNSHFSGKTSWVAPILDILDEEEIATCTNEGKFATSMVSESTQLMLLDEWSPDSLQVDEAKRIFQGGLQFIPTKHGSPRRLSYNAGIYITANVVRNSTFYYHLTTRIVWDPNFLTLSLDQTVHPILLSRCNCSCI